MPGASQEWIRILEQLLAGDRLAFMKINRLITGFLSRLHAYDHREEWEDLRQEVLLAIVASARAGRLRDPAAFVAYVQSTTRNKFVDRLKRAGRTHEKKQVPWNEQIEKLAGTAAAAISGDGRAREIWFAVADLPDQHQQVLEGIYRQGKTYEEVARDTGIPLGTVKRRLREGLTELRRRFAETRDA